MVAWEEDKELPNDAPKPARTDGLSDELAAHMSELAFSLGLTEEEQDVRSTDFTNCAIFFNVSSTESLKF